MNYELSQYDFKGKSTALHLARFIVIFIDVIPSEVNENDDNHLILLQQNA